MEDLAIRSVENPDTGGRCMIEDHDGEKSASMISKFDDMGSSVYYCLLFAPRPNCTAEMGAARLGGDTHSRHAFDNLQCRSNARHGPAYHSLAYSSEEEVTSGRFALFRPSKFQFTRPLTRMVAHQVNLSIRVRTHWTRKLRNLTTYPRTCVDRIFSV